ncbi:DNA-directed RNA polymerase subunit E'' [Candidatus Woesearchaeota archaeon]|nr:DNA-directed RNA polymerase subunit E'' [Candidatus Woesearchaeota archaeon]
MSKRVVCRNCKIFFEEGGSCPVCKRNSFATSWQGRIQFINAEKSVIAQKMGVEKDGEYAIKIR